MTQRTDQSATRPANACANSRVSVMVPETLLQEKRPPLVGQPEAGTGKIGTTYQADESGEGRFRPRTDHDGYGKPPYDLGPAACCRTACRVRHRLATNQRGEDDVVLHRRRQSRRSLLGHIGRRHSLDRHGVTGFHFGRNRGVGVERRTLAGAQRERWWPTELLPRYCP